MAVAGNLSGLLQPFDEQSPINLIAMISQLGQQNPAALAALLAKTGAQPPPVPTLSATSPFAGGGGFSGLAGGQGGDVLGVPGATPVSAPAPLPATTSPVAAAATGGEKPGRVEGLLKSLSALVPPPEPALPRPPAAQLPRGGGPAPNPELLALLAKLLQGAQPQGIPSLGQLIGGGSGVPAAPTVQF